MKKLFNEPEIEILKFLCNETGPDTGSVGEDGDFEEGDLEDIIL